MIIALTDDLMIGSRISGMLEMAGYGVRVFADPDALREAQEAGIVDAIVLPFAARSFDGIAAIRALRADERTARLPILAFGPHVDTEARTAARAAGATRVVTNGAFFTRMPAIVAALLANEPGTAADDE